jgi:hypothetical protein
MFSRMALRIKTTVSDNLLHVAFEGDYSFPELLEQIQEIRTAADTAGCEHALIDATGVNGRMTESEKFFAGTKIAELFGPKLKAAIVMPIGDVTKMGEMAAVNRGARLLVTESRAEATAWLTVPQLRTVA